MTALEKWKNDFKEFISELSMPEDDYYGIMQYIDEVPNETRWIPVNERLPEDFQRVLVTIVNYKGDKVVRVAEYYNCNNNNRKRIFHINETLEQWEVGEKGLLAWLPLPKPYETQESEG